MKGYGKKAPGKYSFGSGLELHVGKTGVSSWKLRTRSDDKDTTVNIGSANAHHNERWARSRMTDIENGSAIEAGSLGSALEDWAESKLITKRWSDRHYTKTLERMRKHCSGLWDLQMANLTRPVVVQELEKIPDIDTAGRVYSWIRECLETQVDRGSLKFCVLGRKPETLTLPKSQKNRHKSLEDDYDQLRELFRAIRLSDATRSVRLAGQVSILSGLRLGEVVILRTDYVKEDRIIIPRELMKVKDHWRKDYQLPIPGELGSLIDAAVESAHEGWLFHGVRSRAPITLEAVEKQFRQLSQGRHVPHGSRRSLRTFAVEELKVRDPVADSLLDHATADGTAAHYEAAQYFDERASALAAWGNLLSH